MSERETMAQIGEAGTGDSELAATQSAATARSRLIVPLLLAAGWGTLFLFMTMVLMDDEPAASDPVAPRAGIGAQAAAFEMPSELFSVPVRDGPRLHRPEPQRVVALPVAMPAAERLEETVPSSSDVAPAKPALSPHVGRVDYIGTWGPTARACGAPSRRRGYIPAVLTQDGARAGRTLCRFRNGRRDGGAWAVAAECTERGRRWISQVRLVVDGDRLTWTSAKGASSYVRCGRRDG